MAYFIKSVKQVKLVVRLVESKTSYNLYSAKSRYVKYCMNLSIQWISHLGNSLVYRYRFEAIELPRPASSFEAHRWTQLSAQSPDDVFVTLYCQHLQL